MTSNRIKSIEIVIESLKLYIALATLLFGGLLTLIGFNFNSKFAWTGTVALILFLLAIIMSVLTVNSLINKVYRNDDEAIKRKDSIFLNFLSIILLLSGMIFGSVFILNKQENKLSPIDIDNVLIEGDKITIPSDIKQKVKIVRDSLGGFEFSIN